MTVNNEHIALGAKLVEALRLPAVKHVHIPPSSSDDEKQDEFGFIFLEDGSIGPFYVSLDNTRSKLKKRLMAGRVPQTRDLPQLLSRKSLDERALAIGLFNACSDHVMRRAGYTPAGASSSTGDYTPQPGDTVGMVGYFRPLVEQLTRRGCSVIVLERQPERVVVQPGVHVATEPHALATCRSIICTAATLINDSLDTLLTAATAAKSFSLIGPTASGLPDVLFARGVMATGGIWFDDTSVVKEKLAQNMSWGEVGQKYQLTPDNYPGVDTLLQRISRRGR